MDCEEKSMAGMAESRQEKRRSKASQKKRAARVKPGEPNGVTKALLKVSPCLASSG